MVNPVTKELFDMHRQHVDKRFDKLEELMTDHTHGDKVPWAAFLTTVLGLITLMVVL